MLKESLILSRRHVSYLLSSAPGHQLLVWPILCARLLVLSDISERGLEHHGINRPGSQCMSVRRRDFQRRPHVCLRFWLTNISRRIKWLPLLVQLMRGRRVYDGKHRQTVLSIYMTVKQYFGCIVSLKWCEKKHFHLNNTNLTCSMYHSFLCSCTWDLGGSDGK